MSLEKFRKQIDEIDSKIIPLLEKRLLLAKELRKFKTKTQDSSREDQILKKIKSKYIQDIYLSIFKNSKKIQEDNYVI